MADLMDVCKAGAAGCCSIILIVLGVIVCFPGLALLVVGTAHNNEDFYQDSNRELQVIGGVLLSVGVVMIAIAVFLCCYVCGRVNQPQRAHQGAVLSTNPSQTTATVMTGYSPVPTSHPQYVAQPHPPAQQQYPPAQQQYPPAQQQYPPAQQYPAPNYPQQQYQQTQQAPAPQRQPEAYGAPPPPLNPDYSHSAQPTAPYPTLEKAQPTAPPQHVMSFKR